MGITDFFRKREKEALRADKRGAKSNEPAKEEKPVIQVTGKTKYHWRKDIIWEPIITEKTHRLSQANNTVTFKTSPQANRSEIKEAVEKIFNVKVEKVRTELVKRRERGRTRIRSVRLTHKKAYVTLRPGSRIALFE